MQKYLVIVNILNVSARITRVETTADRSCVWLYGRRSTSVAADCLYACSVCDTQRRCSSSMRLVALYNCMKPLPFSQWAIIPHLV